MINKELLKIAEKKIKDHPEHFSEETIKNIRAQKIVLRMTTYELRLAGGSFICRVVADPKWPSGIDPLHIIDSQTNAPDNSIIDLTFQNSTQFPEENDPVSFRVEVRLGKVVNIKRLT